MNVCYMIIFTEINKASILGIYVVSINVIISIEDYGIIIEIWLEETDGS